MKNLITAFLLLSTVATAQAANYFDKEEACLNTADIQAVEANFTQFSQFTSSGSTVCKEDVDEKWFEVMRSVLALKELTLTNRLQRDSADDFTRRPIGQKDWWSYFTERADRFVIEPSRCSSNENIVAFVYPFIRDSINLCPLFFELDPASQIETLMHEVRHFEGHSHVTCSQGNENGSSGACDRKITSGGSYAVSVQASVELSYVDQLSYENRVLSESSAIYSINNKFNSQPTVKASDYIYLSNTKGEVYRAATDNLAQTEFVAKLDSPSAIYSNGSQFTVFPLSGSEEAYRKSKDFEVAAKSIGAYANMFNADADKSAYGATNYFGTGGITKGEEIYTFCGKNAQGMTAFEYTRDSISAILNLKDDEGEDITYIVNGSGDLLKFNCDNDSGELSLDQTGSSFPAEAVAGFSNDTETAYYLTDSGELMSFSLKSEVASQTDLPGTNWISATPLKVYSVFDPAN